MVTEFGMSDAIGAINYEETSAIDSSICRCRPSAACTPRKPRRRSTREIKRILTDAHNKAREVLSSNRDKLERVTRRLLEIEVMEGDELRRLLELPPAEPSVDKVPLPPTDTPTSTQS
jgi:cell division protease FtsH